MDASLKWGLFKGHIHTRVRYCHSNVFLMMVLLSVPRSFNCVKFKLLYDINICLCDVFHTCCHSEYQILLFELTKVVLDILALPTNSIFQLEYHHMIPPLNIRLDNSQKHFQMLIWTAIHMAILFNYMYFKTVSQSNNAAYTAFKVHCIPINYVHRFRVCFDLALLTARR